MKFSGRIDQLLDEIYYYEDDEEEYCGLTMLEVFDEFVERFECENFIFAFEDRDKTNLFPRKPHYHFIFESYSKKDTMRRFLTKNGFSGTTASLHEITDEKEFEKSMIYILKQQNVVFTDYKEDILERYLEASKSYQAEIKKTLNISQEVPNAVIEILKNKYITTIPTRMQIGEEVFNTFARVNMEMENADVFHPFPNTQTLLKMIQFIEFKTDFVNFKERWMEDNKIILNKTAYTTEKITQIKYDRYREIFEEN